VNCGAIPETLLESELFGYEKGAFTDARSEGKKGWVETANHGTLFLDEISELPLPLQVKLLKFLDDMSFMPVGGVSRRTVQVKIVAASNVDLEQLVSTGRFRHDLIFRLNVLPITIPPLRERREDIPLLAEYFLKVFEKRYAKSKCISSEALIALMHNDYSGNVRELRNIIERVFIMTPGDTIELTDLPASLRERVACAGSAAEKRNLHELLKEYERRIIESAVHQHRTTYDAAAALGVNQSTIVRKLQSYRRTG
jgi:transcriptional regulator with PAS, ATPase and Fis domain